jgi:hypothetical protein
MEVDDGATTAGDAESLPDFDVVEPLLCCSRCYRTLARASQLLLAHTESWCGALHGVCFRCSDFNPKERVESSGAPPEPDDEANDDDEDKEQRRKFKRASNKMWTKRQQELKGRVERVRSVTFKNLMDKVAAQLPGLKNAEIRKITVWRIAAAVTTFLAGISAVAGLKQAAEFCTMRYKAEIELEAQQPTYSPPAAGLSLSQQEAQFLDTLCDGLHVMFLCRNMACLFTARGRDWIQHRTKGQYMCPRCFQKYRPWVESGDRIAAQKAVLLKDPVSGGMHVFAAVWPASAEDGWLLSMCEAHARLVDGSKLSAQFMVQNACQLSHLLEKVGVPGGLRQHRLPADVHKHVEASAWSWDHLLVDGFWGLHLPAPPERGRAGGVQGLGPADRVDRQHAGRGRQPEFAALGASWPALDHNRVIFLEIYVINNNAQISKATPPFPRVSLDDSGWRGF